MKTSTPKKEKRKGPLGRGLDSLFAPKNPSSFPSSSKPKPTPKDIEGRTHPLHSTPPPNDSNNPNSLPPNIPRDNSDTPNLSYHQSQTHSPSLHAQYQNLKKSTGDEKGEDISKRLWHLPIHKLHPNRFQPRKAFDSKKLEELALSIKEKGIFQPIMVRKDKDKDKEGQFEIIAGERRWRAAQKAGWTEVPVLIQEVSDQSSMELALIENIQREDLNPIEEALAYSRLLTQSNWNQKELAQRLGKDRSSVANLLRILNLKKEVQQWIIEGTLSLGHAKLLASLEKEKQLSFGQKTREEHLSVRALEKSILQDKKKEPKQSFSEPLTSSSHKRSPSPYWVKDLEQQIEKSLGVPVQLDYKDAKGKIHISFYSDETLNKMIEKLIK